MERFELWRRRVGLSLEQAARLWAEGIRTPEDLLGRAGGEEGCAELHLLTGVDVRKLLALVAAAQDLRDSPARSSSGKGLRRRLSP